VVTRLDHDANVTPWVLAGRIMASRLMGDFDVEDGTLELVQLQKALERKAAPSGGWYAPTPWHDQSGRENHPDGA